MTLSMPPPRTECADSKQYEQEVLYCQFRISNFSTDGHERFRWNRFDLSIAEVAIGSPRTLLRLCGSAKCYSCNTFSGALGCQLRAVLWRANLQLRMAVAGTGFLTLMGTEKQCLRALVVEAGMSLPACSCQGSKQELPGRRSLFLRTTRFIEDQFSLDWVYVFCIQPIRKELLKKKLSWHAFQLL